MNLTDNIFLAKSSQIRVLLSPLEREYFVGRWAMVKAAYLGKKMSHREK